MPVAHLPARSPSPPAKRIKLDHIYTDSANALSLWTRRPVNYGQGVHLAPMVRSGSLPSRLLALDAGAELVWGPEIVDRAIIGCERVVDARTGVITYRKSDRTIFTLHPIERPRHIFQIGSANPELAAEAARIVCQDVAGIDLNCGCPKPFSTHSGMGAGLLQTPDKLCAILTAIRQAIPSDIPVSCKIRLLPLQEQTLALVKQIVGTGAIQCLTVHCRTPPMRPNEPALVSRLREIVEAVGSEVIVVENGDCLGWADAERVRIETGVKAVMIARAAEANTTCFRPEGVEDAETVVIPRYMRLARYLDHPWANTKFCAQQITSPHPILGKAGRQKWKMALARSKTYDDLVREYDQGEDWLNGGEEIIKGIEERLEAREARLTPVAAVTECVARVANVPAESVPDLKALFPPMSPQIPIPLEA